MFSPDETSYLGAALEEFLDGPSIPFTAEVRDKLVRSSLSKLESYTMLTQFTKQEYTIMYCALNRIASQLSDDDPLYDSVVSLLHKVGELAT